MLQMTRHINTDWKTHVARRPASPATPATAASRAGEHLVQRSGPARRRRRMARQPRRPEHRPYAMVGLTSLPNDPFTPFLRERRRDPRHLDDGAARTAAPPSIKQTEGTYGLMMHMSQALGRQLHVLPQHPLVHSSGTQSTPQRATAWYGIRMVRDLNADYLEPLDGDVPGEPPGPARRRAQAQLRHLPPGREQAAARRQPCLRTIRNCVRRARCRRRRPRAHRRTRPLKRRQRLRRPRAPDGRAARATPGVLRGRRPGDRASWSRRCGSTGPGLRVPRDRAQPARRRRPAVARRRVRRRPRRGAAPAR